MNNWGEIDANFLSLVQLLMNQIRANCLFLVPAFLLMGFIVALIRAVFTNGEMMLDPGFLLRGVVIWLLLFNYVELMDLVTGAIEGFKNLVPATDGLMKRLNTFATSVVTLKPTEPDPNASPLDRLLDFAQGAFNFQFGLQYWLVSMIEQGLTMMIRIGYEKLRAMLLAFLTVVGPLSLTLSVFPGMEKVASHWFRGWFVVHMWSVTLRVLDSIIVAYNDTVFDAAMNNGETAFMDSILINLVCVLMYFLVPSLTSYFVGYAATAGFFSKLAGVVATGARVAAFGVGEGGKMASASGGSFSGSSTSTAATYGGGGGGNGGGGGPALPQGPASPLALGPGGGYLLGGGSPTLLPPGGGPLPPLSGGNAAAIPVRQLPSVPQPRPVPLEAPSYSPYEIVA
ncbi:MAG: hypothetical protein ICV83_09260 [Cytophagales bacterium]|nr:hypothetical protein [Cytophagales bacterium]